MDHMVDKAWNGETDAIDPTLSPMLLRSFEAHTLSLSHTHTHTHTQEEYVCIIADIAYI